VFVSELHRPGQTWGGTPEQREDLAEEVAVRGTHVKAEAGHHPDRARAATPR